MHLFSRTVQYVQVDSTAEGEAQRYFDHAITLRDTILFLRHNRELNLDAADQNGGGGSAGLGVDLLRCESLLGLDPATCARVLNKNYAYASVEFLCSQLPLCVNNKPSFDFLAYTLGDFIIR